MDTNSKEETLKLVNIYTSQLTEIEKKILIIAKDQLESSFSIEKSIGFKQWLKNN
jgi:hypothetical protein